MDQDGQVLVRVTADRQLASEWELTLIAQGLSPILWNDPEGVGLSVPEEEAERARAALSVFDGENVQRPPPPVERFRPEGFFAGAVVGVVLLLVFIVTTHIQNVPWLARGSADARSILNGELWRIITALTLHADVAHALSNAAALALFAGAVSTMVGAGFGCALVLISGAFGNLINAIMQGSPHVTVGASTAVFGAVGLLGALAGARRRRLFGRRRAWLPIAAAFALLGMLGTAGGARVDIWAHLFGLIAGTVLGLIAALLAPRSPRPTIQWACAIVAIATVVLCWAVALI
jgi:membrane associated rhomboid family serine protease